jgi:tetratricopeptide (TPR) repeat protein
MRHVSAVFLAAFGANDRVSVALRFLRVSVYRRNISSILGSLAAILALFVAYHAWLKPYYFPTSPHLPPSVSEDEVPTTPRPVNEPPIIGTKRPRTIDPVTIPVQSHMDLFGSINEELEKGNAPKAEEKLADIPAAVLSDPKARRHVAILWNNLGIVKERLEGIEASLAALKKAAALDPDNPIVMLNLAHTYWGLRDPSLTIEFLDKVITLAPDEAFPHLAIADLLQEQDRLTEAGRHLRDARDRIKTDPALQSYLTTVAAKIERAGKIEDKLTSRSSAHFIVKFDGEEDHATWTAVLDILEEAYREIGQKFNHFPAKPITVTLLTKSGFQNATGSPVWADGLFDPVLGRIQVPTRGALTDKIWLARVLRHEFVHALLHDQLGSEIGSIPTWLNEGLAMQLSGDPWQELDRALDGDGQMVPLTALEGSWEGLSPEAATVAYFEANSATHYLLDRFGMHKVHDLLGYLKARQTIAIAMQDKLLLSYDRFQQQWVDEFHSQLHHQRS